MDAGLDRVKAGLFLGRYECLAPIARGGMAAVWAARLIGARGFEKVVALKTVLPALTDDPSYITMFLDEGRIASRIRHPNVVSVLDLGEEGELIYLVMDWVDGEPLSLLLREALSKGQCFPMAVAAKIAVDACAGLHAAHELCDDDGAPAGLVHRDVSPQNVLVSTDGIVKLVDFGIAKATLRSSPETEPGVMKGKVAFMAPEQALGQPLDRRADLFSVGVLLFQMLTGKHPFRGDNDMATLTNALTRPAPSLAQVSGRGIPAALDAAVRKALSRHREDRPGSALELSRSIEQSLGEPLASAEEVAAFLRSVLGHRIDERQATLRAAIEQADRGDEGLGGLLARGAPAVSAEVSERWSIAAVPAETGITPPPGSSPGAGEAAAAGLSPDAVTARRSSLRSRGAMAAGALLLLAALSHGLSLRPRSAPAQALAEGPAAAGSARVVPAGSSPSDNAQARSAPSPLAPAPLVPPAPLAPAASAEAVARAAQARLRSQAPERALPPPGSKGRWAQPVPTPGF